MQQNSNSLGEVEASPDLSKLIDLAAADATAVISYFQNLYPESTSDDVVAVLMELARQIQAQESGKEAPLGWHYVRLPAPFQGWALVREWLTAENIMGYTRYANAEKGEKLPKKVAALLPVAREFWLRVSAGFIVFEEAAVRGKAFPISADLAISDEFPMMLGAFVLRETAEALRDATNLKK